MPWFLYSSNAPTQSLYGIATDVDARFAKHVSGTGARYTRSHKPVCVRASFLLDGRAQLPGPSIGSSGLSAARKWALVGGELTLDAVMPAEVEDAPEIET